MDERSLIRRWESAIIGLLIFIGFTISAVDGIKEEAGGYIQSIGALADCFTGDVVRSVVLALAGLLSFAYSTFVLVQHYRGKSTDICAEDEDDVAEDSREAYVSKESVPYVLEQGKFSIQFMVPYNYTWDKKEKPDIDEDLGMVMFPRFTREDGAIVDCQLHIEPIEDVENGDNIDALEDVQDQLGYLSEKEQKNVKIKQVVVDGKYIVHYFVEKKKSGFDKLQRLYAACNLDRGKYFVLEMWCMSWEPELDVEAFSEFFHFEEGAV